MTRTVKGQFLSDSLNYMYVIVFVNINTLCYLSPLIIHLHLKTFDRTTEAGFYSVQISNLISKYTYTYRKNPSPQHSDGGFSCVTTTQEVILLINRAMTIVYFKNGYLLRRKPGCHSSGYWIRPRITNPIHHTQ